MKIASGQTSDLDGEWSVCATPMRTEHGWATVELNTPSSTTWLTLTELRELRAGLDAAISHLEGKE